MMHLNLRNELKQNVMMNETKTSPHFSLCVKLPWNVLLFIASTHQASGTAIYHFFSDEHIQNLLCFDISIAITCLECTIY